MSDVTERMRAMVTTQDHERGCDGRMYTCTCGHDARIDATIAEAADEIERLRAALRRLCSAADAMADICNSGICEEATEEAEKLLARAALGNPHD